MVTKERERDIVTKGCLVARFELVIYYQAYFIDVNKDYRPAK